MTQFAVLHMNKYSCSSLTGIGNHIDRKNIPKNADPERTKLNHDYVTPEHSLRLTAQNRINEGYKGKRKIRANAIYSCGFILSGSHERMREMSMSEIHRWAVKNKAFFEKRYGEKNITRCTLHMDEKTPHIHLHLVPLTKDGRLSAKELFGKADLKKLQTDYANEMSEFGLERGISGSSRTHTTTHDFYRFIEKNELDAKKIIKSDKAVEIIGLMLQETMSKGEHQEFMREYRIKNTNTYSNVKNEQISPDGGEGRATKEERRGEIAEPKQRPGKTFGMGM